MPLGIIVKITVSDNLSISFSVCTTAASAAAAAVVGAIQRAFNSHTQSIPFDRQNDQQLNVASE